MQWMLGYGAAVTHFGLKKKKERENSTGVSYFVSDRTGWRLIYSDSSSFTSHVQIVTWRRIMSLGLGVCVCPCFQISDSDKSVQEMNTDICHLVNAYV